MYGLFCLISMYELIWLNSAAIIIYYICCTNDAILLYENIFFDGKKVFAAGSCLSNGSGTGGDGPAITIDLNPMVPKTVGDALLESAVIEVVVVV